MINSPERETPVEEMMGWASEIEDSHAGLTRDLFAIEEALNNDKVPDAENIKYARTEIEKLHSYFQHLDEALARLQEPALTIVGKD